MKKFDKIKYIDEYNKENYKRFTAKVKKEKAIEIEKFKAKEKVSNTDIFLAGFENLKKH